MRTSPKVAPAGFTASGGGPVLVTSFAFLAFGCVAALAVVMGLALSSRLTHAVSEWEWQNTAALVQREVRMNGLWDSPRPCSPTGCARRSTLTWRWPARRVLAAPSHAAMP
ncbi:MAG: hypothetical protein ACREM3_07540 [Candidatus Rokuibacteriota bacterium]